LSPLNRRRPLSDTRTVDRTRCCRVLAEFVALAALVASIDRVGNGEEPPQRPSAAVAVGAHAEPQAPDEDDQEAALLRRTAAEMWIAGQRDRAVRLLEESLQRLRKPQPNGHDKELVRALDALGTWLWHLDRPEDSLKVFREGAKIADRLPARHLDIANPVRRRLEIAMFERMALLGPEDRATLRRVFQELRDARVLAQVQNGPDAFTRAIEKSDAALSEHRRLKLQGTKWEVDLALAAAKARFNLGAATNDLAAIRRALEGMRHALKPLAALYGAEDAETKKELAEFAKASEVLVNLYLFRGDLPAAMLVVEQAHATRRAVAGAGSWTEVQAARRVEYIRRLVALDPQGRRHFESAYARFMQALNEAHGMLSVPTPPGAGRRDQANPIQPDQRSRPLVRERLDQCEAALRTMAGLLNDPDISLCELRANLASLRFAYEDAFDMLDSEPGRNALDDQREALKGSKRCFIGKILSEKLPSLRSSRG